MVSVIFQIFGNILLVWAIIFQPFSEISKYSRINVSEQNKREKITNNFKTKVKIIIGLVYVIIGLIFSIPCINSFIQKVSLFSTCYLIAILIFILFLIAFVMEKLFVFIYKEKIDKAVNEKQDGEIWIE